MAKKRHEDLFTDHAETHGHGAFGRGGALTPEDFEMLAVAVEA